MDLQTLAKAFEDAVQAQRLIRLGHLEDANYVDVKDAGKLSGHCSGLKQALGIFGEVVRNLFANPTQAPTPTPPNDDPTQTPLPPLTPTAV